MTKEKVVALGLFFLNMTTDPPFVYARAAGRNQMLGYADDPHVYAHRLKGLKETKQMQQLAFQYL